MMAPRKSLYVYAIYVRTEQIGLGEPQLCRSLIMIVMQANAWAQGAGSAAWDGRVSEGWSHSIVPQIQIVPLTIITVHVCPDRSNCRKNIYKNKNILRS